jgi:5-formyltetrahydrofolate cyclo-ligase
MTVEEIREYIDQQQTGMGLPILEANGYLAVKRLKTRPIYHNAKKVGAYAPVANQVDITFIMTQEERTFYVPAFDEERGVYRFAEIGETFKRNRFGGIEPVDPVFVDDDEIDVILVPGIAFDEAGRRIGPEQDFYDELLPQYNAPRVGLACDVQRLKDLPVSDESARMNELVTESYAVTCPPSS